MDQSYSESDISLSPSQILQRLQVLRQLQLMQRGKLHKQRLQYQQETTETSSSITEIVSHFSNSTSYNTFRSLLQSPPESSNDTTPRQNTNNVSQQIKEQDLIEGVSALNLSQESEFIINSPVSSQSRGSLQSRNEITTTSGKSPINRNVETKSLAKKQITLDEIPILSPKQDFEALILEKLKNEKVPKVKIPKKDNVFAAQNKKPFLRRGEGLNRFGLRKNDLVIQNTKSLPWKRKSLETKTVHSPVKKKLSQKTIKNNDNVEVEILVTEPKASTNKNTQPGIKSLNTKDKPRASTESQKQSQNNEEILIDSSNCDIHCANDDKPGQSLQLTKGKHPLPGNKGKSWAAVLTKEQDAFLRQLKQSNYYKNFVSPAKSIVSDISCDDNLYKLRQERETAEQNMFELLENKVSHESFNFENSFVNKFLKRSKLECSGESTPLIMQKCLAENPALMHIFPEHKNRNETSVSEVDAYNSEYTDCCSDCSCASSCCSRRTVEEVNISTQSCINNKEVKKSKGQKAEPNKCKSKEVERVTETQCQSENQCHNDTITENDKMKANMAEMNAKLVATSDLLKDRLRELEDEIETFRKENTNLTKLREEVDLERQKFYEEKSAFEQKFNEEKILSEYYLAEEKEKLTKQKQMYERYVREMRGRLNKKEKDEVISLRKEISDLKEDIRMKDAKSTSTIARLRNQIKIMEKEKKDLQDGVEKLKKENRRIQHSNDITRRLTNMKYLEQINKKLTHMSSKETKSEIQLDNDVKYKAYEIERQSRSKRVQPVTKGCTRPRAKSVPNINVTSRYAKYFSQRDAISQMDKDIMHVEHLDRYSSENDDMDNNDNILNDTESEQGSDFSDNETGNHLEKMYMERFKSTSPASNISSLTNPASASSEKPDFKVNPDGFFIRKSNSGSTKDSKSPITSNPYLHISNESTTNRTKSPVSILSNTSNGRHSPINMNKEYISNPREHKSRSRTKSPISILSNRSSSSRLTAVINQDQYRDKLLTVSPEPSTSKTSLTKTNLNPTEIKKPDGSKEIRFPNGNVKYLSADGKYSKFVYYNGDVKENFYDDGRIKYFYAEAKTFHTTHADGLEVLEFPDGQVEKRYKDGSTEIRLPNGSIRYFDPKNEHVREEWRFPDGTALTVSAGGEQRVAFGNGQVEVHANDHKRREFPDGTVKLVYNDGTSETRYASGRVRIKDKHGHLIMDSAPG